MHVVAKETLPAQDDPQIFMDLGDFVPQECTMRFSISGREYRFRFVEAHVDEVFLLISAEQEAKTVEEVQRSHRNVVAIFLSRYLVEGDPEQFRKDLDTVPYVPGVNGRLSIARLFAIIRMRVKKNESGDDLEILEGM